MLNMFFFWQILISPTTGSLVQRTGGWCDEPRLGEADRPGPLNRLDNPEIDDDSLASESFGVEDDMHDFEFEEPELPGEEQPAAEQLKLGDKPAVLQATETASGELAAWQAKHANVSFVPCKAKKVRKTSRFEGEKPGWIFTSRDNGLGYNSDGPQV